MNRTTKKWIRIAVVVTLFSWPGIETARLIVAKHQLRASQEQQKAVLLHLAQVKSVQVATQPVQP